MSGNKNASVILLDYSHMTHWLLVSSPENFETSRRLGFTVAGMKSRWRKAAGEVQPGDTVFFYVTGQKAIAGEATVIGAAYEDDTVIWESTKPGEVYPHRFPIELVKARAPGDYVPVADFIEDYAYAKRWPAKNWTLAFQGNVHRLSASDYELIHSLI